MLPQNIFRLLVYFAVAAYLSSANADPTQESKAEAALAGKIKCEDFRKNPDGTWTSGPNAKIGNNPFSSLTFESKRVTVGRADLATVLDHKCRQSPPGSVGLRKAPNAPQSSDTQLRLSVMVLGRMICGGSVP
jgi:hypothetical protein